MSKKVFRITGGQLKKAVEACPDAGSFLATEFPEAFIDQDVTEEIKWAVLKDGEVIIRESRFGSGFNKRKCDRYRLWGFYDGVGIVRVSFKKNSPAFDNLHSDFYIWNKGDRFIIFKRKPEGDPHEEERI